MIFLLFGSSYFIITQDQRLTTNNNLETNLEDSNQNQDNPIANDEYLDFNHEVIDDGFESQDEINDGIVLEKANLDQGEYKSNIEFNFS